MFKLGDNDKNYRNERPQAREEILWIEMAGRAIQNEALERYLYNPASLGDIMEALRETRESMKIPSNSSCPVGFSHKNCACVTDIKQG